MLKRIKNTNILVHGYDEAVKFYTEKFGFELYQHFPEHNWVALTVPGNKDHILTFCLAVEDSDKALVGRQTGSYPLFILEIEDCGKIYDDWKNKGVKFIGELTTFGQGRFVIAQDLYGNKLFVSDNKFFKKDQPPSS
jgi:predicted enzyme related to lactoylglutathione lyase